MNDDSKSVVKLELEIEIEIELLFQRLRQPPKPPDQRCAFRAQRRSF
jgi:hypothetical protein